MLFNFSNKVHWFFILLFFILLTYFIPLDSRLLWQPDETRYAEISREMLSSGNWIVPHLLDIRYFEKPVAGYWVNNISQLIFGENNFAVRFGAVFSTFTSAVFLYLLAFRMWKQTSIARIAVYIYLSMLLVFAIGTYSVLDPILSMWISIAIYFSYLAIDVKGHRNKILSWIGLGLACGMALMTKGFLALVIPVITMLPIMIFYRRFSELLKYGWIAVVAATLISLPWALAINQLEPDFWRYFFFIEHVQRFIGNNAQNLSPFWFFIPILLLGSVPWCGFLFGALYRGWKDRKTNPPLFFLLIWCLIPFIFFSVAKGKLLTYILPLIMPIAILIAAYIDQLIKDNNTRIFTINGWCNLVTGILGIITLLVLNIADTELVYADDESYKFYWAIGVFLVWILFAALSLIKQTRFWYLAAFCTIAVSLSVSSILPNRTVRANLPQEFINQNRDALNNARYILTNSVGVGSGLAWELKRGDIYMFDRTGELDYGLKYPDSRDHYIDKDDFSTWLKQARKEGNVAVVLRERHSTDMKNIPQPQWENNNGTLSLEYFEKCSIHCD